MNVIHSQWSWKLLLLPSLAASTTIFSGSFHDIPLCTSTYSHEYLKLPAASTGTPWGSTDFHLWYFHGSFHQRQWKEVNSKEASTNLHGCNLEVIVLPLKLMEARFTSTEVCGSFLIYLRNHFHLPTYSHLRLSISTSTGFHWLPSTSICFHWFPRHSIPTSTTFINFHRPPPTSTDFHLLPRASTPTSIHFHLLLPSYTDFV